MTDDPHKDLHRSHCGGDINTDAIEIQSQTSLVPAICPTLVVLIAVSNVTSVSK